VPDGPQVLGLAEPMLAPNPWDCWVTVDGAIPGQSQWVTGSLLNGTAVFH
jgi:hypothetical protein